MILFILVHFVFTSSFLRLLDVTDCTDTENNANCNNNNAKIEFFIMPSTSTSRLANFQKCNEARNFFD